MTVRERRRDQQDPVHSWRQPRTFSRKNPLHVHARLGGGLEKLSGPVQLSLALRFALHLHAPQGLGLQRRPRPLIFCRRPSWATSSSSANELTFSSQ
jgi:hypothetical protein